MASAAQRSFECRSPPAAAWCNGATQDNPSFDPSSESGQVRTLDAQKRLLDETVAGYTQYLELTRNRYAAGVASQVDAVQAFQDRRMTAAVQLIEALGGGWSDVGLPTKQQVTTRQR
jgi:hypothetical protein